jgi:hypothetical protein
MPMRLAVAMFITRGRVHTQVTDLLDRTVRISDE